MEIGVFSTIATAFKFCWTHRTQFCSLASPAVIILAISSTLIMAFQPQDGFQAASFKTSNQHIHFSKDFFLYAYTGSILQGLSLFLLLLFKIYILCTLFYQLLRKYVRIVSKLKALRIRFLIY